MRIAYCIPGLYYPSGMERVLTLKANYLAEVFGYEIHIILTEGKDRNPYYELHSPIIIHQLDINYDELNGMPFFKRLMRYLAKQKLYKQMLDACLNRIKPDITVSLLRREINFINSLTDGSVKIGELHFNKSNYRDCGDSRLPASIREAGRKYWQTQLHNELLRLKRFVVLTHEDARQWIGLTNVEVIHNPLSFLPDYTSEGTSKQVIAVGRYVPQKGFDLLIPAWHIVAQRHPDWVLRIYGDGMRTELQLQIDMLGITSNCILEPTAPNIVDRYCESSIFVLSSRFEGFGMVITEAMACGIPPVAFACPCGPRDIIDDGIDGLLVENGNIEELAEKICYLIENEDVRKEMGRQARINVRRFRIEHIAEQWKQLFEELVANNQSPHK